MRGAKFIGAIRRQPQELRGPVTGVGHAPRSFMSIGYSRDLIAAAGVEKMQDRERRPAGGIHAAKTVPESAARHSGDVESGFLNLAMEFVQTVDGEFGQRVGIDFRAAIGSGVDAVRELCAVALHLARAGVEQQSAHRRAAYVDADDKGIARGGAHGEFPL